MLKQRLNKAVTKVQTMDALLDMQKKLQKLGPIPNGKDIYDYAIKFFNIIVEFQDKYAVDIETFSKTTEDAEALAKHIKNSGRDEYGWVRAPRGESVTLHNLYLGNIYGIWTNTAACFKESKDSDVQKIIQMQLRGFIQSHREPMIKYISSVLGGNKKPDNFIVKAAVKKAERQ